MKFPLCIASVVFLALPVQATMLVTPWKQLYQGVWHAVGTNVPDTAIPRNQVANALRIDLTNPDVELFSNPPCTNACTGEALGRSTSKFLEAYEVQAAINSSFFDPCCAEREGSTRMTIRGLAISQGRIVSGRQAGYLTELLFTTNNIPTFFDGVGSPPSTVGKYTAVAGDVPLVLDGVPFRVSEVLVNPRTAIGISEDERYLYLMTIDGRQVHSAGATHAETAAWMIRFGGYNALNVDGGGSATMVAADCTGRATQLSSPVHSGLPGSERVVPNHFGVFAKPIESFITDVNVEPESTTAVISWKTDAGASSQVAYGVTPSFGNVTELDPTLVTEHSVTLTGLNPLTNYFFRIFSEAGGTNHTADSCFSTSDNARVGQIFDITNVWKFNWVNLDGIDWQDPAYNDTGWPEGPGLLWVDTRPIPLESVQPKGIRMPVDESTTYPYITYYFRTHFTFSNSTAGVSLTFSNYLDDGAVYYLNGVEIHRQNIAPAPAVIDNATLTFPLTSCDGNANCPVVFTVTEDTLGSLVVGDNVLAVEVHNYNARSPDITFGAGLSYRLPPPLTGFIDNVVVTPGETTSTITWTTLAEATAQVDYGLTPTLGITTPLNAEPGTNHTVQLTDLDLLTSYYFRVTSTVGAESYSAGGRFSTTPFYQPVLPLTASWTFTTNNLDGQDWAAPDYDDSGWLGEGPGLLLIETNPDVFPRGTILPGVSRSLPSTYYFRTQFLFTNTLPGFALLVTNVVDDGAVFYLNGTEVKRLRIPDEPAFVPYSSLATEFPLFGDAVVPEVFRISGSLLTNLISGTNVLAAEVHQHSRTSSDVVFGASVGYSRASASETTLRITRSGSGACVSWDGTAMTLQQGTDLGDTLSWFDLPGPVRTSPFCVTNSAVTLFFRLRD